MPNPRHSQLFLSTMMMAGGVIRGVIWVGPWRAARQVLSANGSNGRGWEGWFDWEAADQVLAALALSPNYALAALMIVMALSPTASASEIKTQSTKTTLSPIKLFFFILSCGPAPFIKRERETRTTGMFEFGQREEKMKTHGRIQMKPIHEVRACKWEAC